MIVCTNILTSILYIYQEHRLMHNSLLDCKRHFWVGSRLLTAVKKPCLCHMKHPRTTATTNQQMTARKARYIGTRAVTYSAGWGWAQVLTCVYTCNIQWCYTTCCSHQHWWALCYTGAQQAYQSSISDNDVGQPFAWTDEYKINRLKHQSSMYM